MIKIKETIFFYDKENEYLIIQIYFSIFCIKKILQITTRKDYIIELLNKGEE